MVVAAHPDDEVLGCGGAIARMALSVPVYILIVGEGITARFDTREQADSASLGRLHQQASEVAKILGAKSVKLLGLPDNRLDMVPLLELTKHVERALEETRPYAVFTHHFGDLNIDHRQVAQAVLTATRPLPKSCVQEVYAFEVPSATEWAFSRLEPNFRPNIFLDVSDVIERKLTALTLYGGEVRPYPHPRSPQALRARASYWGSVVGRPYAEAFEAVRVIW